MLRKNAKQRKAEPEGGESVSERDQMTVSQSLDLTWLEAGLLLDFSDNKLLLCQVTLAFCQL